MESGGGRRRRRGVVTFDAARVVLCARVRQLVEVKDKEERLVAMQGKGQGKESRRLAVNGERVNWWQGWTNMLFEEGEEMSAKSD